MDANFVAPARIRVLLVPVGPIKKATFERHAKMLQQHATIRLEEISMAPRTENSFFSQNTPHEGQLYFNFVTSYSPEHRYLEEFQLHRRVFGVIGIMDCQEWPSGNMAAGYQEFQKLLSKYPSAVANQCFAFDPSEQQPDDPRGGGVIMIPNVGNTDFYLRVLICDLARSILTEFENIAATVSKRQDIESPSPGIPVLTQKSGAMNGSPSTPTKSATSMDLGSNGVKPLTAPPSAMTSGPPSTHTRSMSAAGFNQMPQPSPALYSQPSVVTDQRLRKRNAARAQKIHGDLYLMAGRLSEAVNSYQSVIETTKANADYLWNASAMEGLYCAVVLLAYLQADMTQLTQQQFQQIASSPTSPTTSEPTKVQPSPAIKPLIVDIPEKYQVILSLYNKVPSGGTPAIIYVEACMKVTKFIATCFVSGNGILDDRALAAVVNGSIYPPASPSSNGSDPSLSTMKPSTPTPSTPLQNSLLRRASTLRSRSTSIGTSSVAVIRTDVMNWINRTWSGRLEELWIIDQIHTTTAIASILGAIQFRRKQSFYLRHAVRMMMPLLHQTRLANAAAQANGSAPKGQVFTSDHGVLECLRQVCRVFGIGDEFASAGTYLEHGWPELQVSVLYECIRVSEAIPDFKAIMYYSTTLLKQLNAFLSREEQAGLTASLPRILAAAKKVGSPDLKEIQYWSKDLVVDIELMPPPARKMPFTRAKDTLKSIIPSEKKPKTTLTGEVDPFIYNPFQRKVNNATKLDLIADETATFWVTLTNPHGIDLDVHDIRLSTSGVKFKALPASAVIPAQSTIVIKVNGVPLEAGDLQIRGCFAKVGHCADQEFFVMRPPPPPAPTNPSGRSNAISDRAPVVVQERPKKTGLDSFTRTPQEEAAEENSAAAAPAVKKEPNFQAFKVIPPQPLLKIKATSLQHGSLMLFEGEKTTFSLTLENIGAIPVDFVTLSFTDSTGQIVAANGNNVDRSAEDAYELELFLKQVQVFDWDRQVNCRIPVGGTREILVDVQGKRGCASGMIQIDYGYLSRPEQAAETEEESTTFVTRQLFSQVLMTVYKTVETLNLDILYLQSHGGMDIQTTTGPNSPTQPQRPGSRQETPEAPGEGVPRIDFSADGFLAPPPKDVGEDEGKQHSGSKDKHDSLSVVSQYKAQGRRGSRTINKRLSSNFARVEKRQSVEQLLSRVRGDGVLPGEQIEAAISRRVALGTKNEYCLLTLDVRNVWTVPVEVAFLVDDSEEGEGLDVDRLIKSTTLIQPGNTQRIILPIRRLALSTAHISQPIPKLTNKQFVVARGAAQQSEEDLQLERSLFWFREELLKRVVARWTCRDNSGRYGRFDLRTLRLTKAMLNVLKIEDISFLVQMEATEAMLEDLGEARDKSEPVDKEEEGLGGHEAALRRLEQTGSNRWRCPIETFAQIRVSVVNRSNKAVKLCLRMQPVQVHGDGTMEYDMGTRMAWHGVLQAPLSKLGPDSTTSHVLPVCFYGRGEFKVLYHAEDVHQRVVYYDHEPLVIEAY
ncbi:hypothetical protein DFQ26_000122 [Actinomortierella ambigua]|nr:hypothetical protein DFQ26_000122 [Actinomortierella ambigua]